MSIEISGNYGNYANTGSTGMTQGSDAISEGIQKQIMMKQQELQKLSENKDMSAEEKMKKRQEINQEISNLNIQLRQHQIEKRREQQQKAESSMEDMLGGQGEAAKPSDSKGKTGLSQGSMQTLISADSAMGQTKVQGSVATRLEGAARTLGGEIKQDAARGINTEAKEKQLAETEQRAMQVNLSQVNTLKKADEEMEEAAKEENETESGGAEAMDRRSPYTSVDIRL